MIALPHDVDTLPHTSFSCYVTDHFTLTAKYGVTSLTASIGSLIDRSSFFFFKMKLHTSYVASVYTDQLQGSTSTSSLDDCSPLEYNGSLVLHPCGLIANTLFNDVITVSSGQNMSETSIAWASDIAEKVNFLH